MKQIILTPREAVVKDLVEAMLNLMELDDSQMRERFRQDPFKYFPVVVYQLEHEYIMREAQNGTS